MTFDNEAYRQWRNESNKDYFETAPTDYEAPDDEEPLAGPDDAPAGWDEDDPDVNPDLNAELPF
jgi:hypothetical protein